MYDALLTTEDVAGYLKVDPSTVRRLVRNGDLMAYRVGSEYRFEMIDVRDYLSGVRVSMGEPDAIDGALVALGVKPTERE